jgi:hypothetical protein
MDNGSMFCAHGIENNNMCNTYTVFGLNHGDDVVVVA